MHPQIESIFDEAENRYLKPEELGVIGQYVESLPERLEAYSKIRDNEIAVMQAVADQLQSEFSSAKVEVLERCIKNALLVLRHCSMGMLLNDFTLIEERLLNWLVQNIQAYNTQQIDTALYKNLNQKLKQVLSPQQFALLQPMLHFAEERLLGQAEASTSAAAIGW